MLFLCIPFFYLNAQRYLPVIEDSITFCHKCSNKHVIDKDWKWENLSDGYTKIRSSNFVYELNRLSDSTYNLKKYDDGRILAKGKILLRENNLVRRDTVSCHHCHPTDLWKEIVLIHSFVRPINIGIWEIVDEEGRIMECNFGRKGLKKESCKKG